jgi:hypothetical protein
MPTYEIWLKGKQDAIVIDGDSVVIAPGVSSDQTYDAYVDGDLLVLRDQKIVAFYKKDEVRGYNEQPPISFGIG